MNETLNFEALPFDPGAREADQSESERELGRRTGRSARVSARAARPLGAPLPSRRPRRPWPGRPGRGWPRRRWRGFGTVPWLEPEPPPWEEPVEPDPQQAPVPPGEDPALPPPAAASDAGQGGDGEPASSAGGGEEGEVKPEVAATITWAPAPFSLVQMRGVQPYLRNRGGIYVVARVGQQPPVYVGISDDLRTRWSTRLALFGELGIAGLLGTSPFSQFEVYIGRVDPQAASQGLSRKDLLESVERVLIRHLKQVRRFPLTNWRGSRPFTVGPSGVNVVNAGTRPWFLPAVIAGGAGQTLEHAPVLIFEAEPFPAARG